MGKAVERGCRQRGQEQEQEQQHVDRDSPASWASLCRAWHEAGLPRLSKADGSGVLHQVHVFVCVCMYACKCVRARVHVYVCVSVYVCMSVCVVGGKGREQGCERSVRIWG